MEISTIYPTGTCIDDAMEYLEQRINQDIDTARGLILVHAICLMPLHQPNAGKRFVHAWVEEDDVCYFMGETEAGHAVVGAEKASFYEELRPQDVTRYTMEDVYKENQRTGTYGPWKQAYIDVITGEQMPPQMTAPMVRIHGYLVEVFWSDADEGFIAIAPDLPGCSAFGETQEEALYEMQDAMLSWLEAARSMQC